MKKIYAILTAALCLSVGAKAQRFTDLQATLTSPANNATITSGQTVAFNAVIKNVGTTTFKSTDTLYYGYLINGSQITFNVNGQSVSTFGVVNRQLAPNDTIQINKNFTLTFSSALDGKKQFCIAILPLNRSVDSMRDNVTSNNASCDSVLFAGGTTTGVATLEAEFVNNTVMSVYPNPAQSTANIELDLSASADVSVRVFDLMGREVMATENRKYGKGKQTISLNTALLNNGLYLYQVMMGNEISTGKLFISK